MLNYGYAVSRESDFLVREEDYSVSLEEVSLSPAPQFDAKANLEEVLGAVKLAPKEEDGLLFSAARAIQRLKGRSEESPEEWAKALAPTFFSDLDRQTL